MELFNFAKRVHDESSRFSETLTFNKQDERHRYLVALYGTLIELAGSLITLIERKHGTGVPPIFRSILEAYIELKNLHEKTEYIHYMNASYYDQWIKVLKETKNKSNRYLKGLFEFEKLDELIQDCEKGLDDLRRKGIIPLNIFQRFERAGMIDEYRSIYNFLSNDAHSNIRALIHRHLDTNGDDFSVVYYKDKQPKDFLPYIDTMALLLLDASLKIHEFFETDALGEIEKLRQELDEIRSK